MLKPAAMYKDILMERLYKIFSARTIFIVDEVSRLSKLSAGTTTVLVNRKICYKK